MRCILAVTGILVASSLFAQPPAPAVPQVRFGLDADPDAYPQATAKDALASVVKAIQQNRIEFLLAYLVDLEFTDAKVRQLPRRPA